MKRLLTLCCLFLILTAAGCSQNNDDLHPGGEVTDGSAMAESAQNSSDFLPSTSTIPVTTILPTTSVIGTAEPTGTAVATSLTVVTASAPTSAETSIPASAETSASIPVTIGSTSIAPTPAPSIDPSAEQFREDSTIIYAARALTLWQEGEAVSVEADTAMIRTGIGENLVRVRWQGGIGYVFLDDITEERPKSAVDLAAEKGGIYYKGTGPLIAIDAGHQDHAMRDTEPLGPGSDEMKAKLSSGTQGVATRLEEYKLNLAVALLLRDELIARGYSVVMIREVNNVELSNAERALIANSYGVDAFIRIHANGSENRSVTGAFTLCQTKNNPYNGSLYDESKRLAETVLQKYIESTGFNRQSIWETDTMTGINWASVPVTLIEMGYMSNENEDRTMATEEFQRAAALGMANGLDLYFGRA